MVAGIAAHLGGRSPGHKWCFRFVDRHRDDLNSTYLDRLDLDRQQATCVTSFGQYFSTTDEKIEETGILLGNTYNMDEKGFLFGRITKAKRIFPKGRKTYHKPSSAGQDGSRE